jgi:succinate dehydrogenase hydrophobic anchor subunit
MIHIVTGTGLLTVMDDYVHSHRLQCSVTLLLPLRCLLWLGYGFDCADLMYGNLSSMAI